jgi:hypothetical protein
VAFHGARRALASANGPQRAPARTVSSIGALAPTRGRVLSAGAAPPGRPQRLNDARARDRTRQMQRMSSGSFGVRVVGGGSAHPTSQEPLKPAPLLFDREVSCEPPWALSANGFVGTPCVRETIPRCGRSLRRTMRARCAPLRVGAKSEDFANRADRGFMGPQGFSRSIGTQGFSGGVSGRAVPLMRIRKASQGEPRARRRFARRAASPSKR